MPSVSLDHSRVSLSRVNCTTVSHESDECHHVAVCSGGAGGHHPGQRDAPLLSPVQTQPQHPHTDGNRCQPRLSSLTQFPAASRPECARAAAAVPGGGGGPVHGLAARGGAAEAGAAGGLHGHGWGRGAGGGRASSLDTHRAQGGADTVPALLIHDVSSPGSHQERCGEGVEDQEPRPGPEAVLDPVSGH